MKDPDGQRPTLDDEPPATNRPLHAHDPHRTSEDRGDLDNPSESPTGAEDRHPRIEDEIHTIRTLLFPDAPPLPPAHERYKLAPHSTPPPNPRLSSAPPELTPERIIQLLRGIRQNTHGIESVMYLGRLFNWTNPREQYVPLINSLRAGVYQLITTYYRVLEDKKEQHPSQTAIAEFLDILSHPAQKTHGFAHLRALLIGQYLLQEFPWVKRDLGEEVTLFLEQMRTMVHLHLSAADNLQGQLAAHAIKIRAFQNHDLLTLNAVATQASQAMSGTEEESAAFLDRFAFTGRSFARVCEILEISQEELQRLRDSRGKVLDIGVGMSDFSIGMQANGIDVRTLDPLTHEEILERSDPLLYAAEQGIGGLATPSSSDGLWGLKEALRDPVQKGLITANHTIGYAAQTSDLLGEGTFDLITACDSIWQNALHRHYRKNPHEFGRTMMGILRALSPNGGEFRGMSSDALVTPLNMDRFFTTFIMAMAVGRFEIVGHHGNNGTLSTLSLMRRQPKKLLTIRRHLESDPDRAEAYMRQVYTQGIKWG